MIRKFAKADIIDVRHSPTRVDSVEGFSKLAKPSPITDDGYLYVTVRAISSRVNKNNDGWPSLELATEKPGYGYKTFEGRPIFIDHNNDNPDRTRGVVVSSILHVEDEKKASSFDPYYANAPEEHLPPTWIELMLEVDAKSFPRLAKHIVDGDVDAVSMGANIELSKCSVCGHEAENPTQYCTHVQHKGATFEITADDGTKSHKAAYEDCYGINFFEISFVFDPADETALISDMSAEREAALKTMKVLASAGLPIPPDLERQAAGPIFPEGKPEFEGGDEIGEAPVPGQEEEQSPMQAPDETEDQQVHKWQMHQLVNEMGATPEQAETFIASGGDYHDLEAFLQKYPKADIDSAMRIVASVDKEAIGPPGREHHNLEQHRQEVERERQLNHEPQADKMTAPEQVDTLRPEIICKNCGSTVDPDNAGQLICQECGVEVEPEGLDNPDLDMAKDIDLRQDKTEEVNPEGEMETELEHDKGETPEKAKSPVRPVAPISSTQSDPVSDEMKFSSVEANLQDTDPKTIDRIVSWMEKNAVEVQDEVELTRLLTESEDFEGEPTIFEAAAGVEAHVAKTAAAQDNADSKTDTKVNTDNKRPNNSAATQSASETVISDQLVPVESSTQFEVLAETESKETSTEESDMAEETKTADRETIKRVEEDGSGTKRTEEITKEFGPMAESGEPEEGEEGAEGESEEAEDEAAEGEESAEGEAPAAEGDAEEVQGEESPEAEGLTEHDPLAEEEKVPAMASVEEEGKLMAALKLAKKASSLGVITSDEELEFAGELEQAESLAEIEARSKMLVAVEEAGLARKQRPVVAGRIPSFKSASAFQGEVDDSDDESLFL
jgi:hypothetical protein